jgi:beta-glucosidase
MLPYNSGSVNLKNSVRFLPILFYATLCFAQPAATSNPLIERRVDQILRQMTLDEKIDYIGGTHDFYVRPIPRLQIPSLRMSDGPMGVHDYGPTTAYPAPIALAASWDVDLAERVEMMLGLGESTSF